MKLSQLLNARDALNRRAQLANLAFAYETLAAIAHRIARARLSGRVTLRPIDPEADRYWATLTALEGSQAAIEEHFTEEDLSDLADAIAYATGRSGLEFTFEISAFSDIFLDPLRHSLEQAGIEIDRAIPQLDTPEHAS